MTERKTSQGPSHATVAASALLVFAVLIGAAYWLGTEGEPTTAEPSALATSTLRALYERCEGGPSHDFFDGRSRARCNSRTHPAFMMEVIGDGEEIERANMLVPLGGTMSQVLDRMLVGLEMFGMVAGVRADLFLPKQYMDAIGTSKTSLVYQGRVYRTEPIPNVGLMFSVTQEGAEAGGTN